MPLASHRAGPESPAAVARTYLRRSKRGNPRAFIGREVRANLRLGVARTLASCQGERIERPLAGLPPRGAYHKDDDAGQAANSKSSRGVGDTDATPVRATDRRNLEG